jgi:Dyp-type peroxidase family
LGVNACDVAKRLRPGDGLDITYRLVGGHRQPCEEIPLSIATRTNHGVVPDTAVLRNPQSAAWLFTVTLRPELDRGGVQAWLAKLTEAVRRVEADAPGGGGSVVAGFGPSFFSSPGGPRFGLERAPADFARLPAVAGIADTSGQGDIHLYVLSPSEAAVAEFERALSATRSELLSVFVEHGYQRRDGREQFGFRDGLRNVISSDRHRVFATDTDHQPAEPEWADGGTYLGYLKARQNLEAMAQLPLAEQEAIMGRRLADGSRPDLPEGTDPRTEGEITGDPPRADSHVRKAGPRGAVHDRTQILRRGVPYLTLLPDGSIDAGLQFVSFQASLDGLDVILNRWMLNPAFPAAGTGQDALFARGLANIVKAGFYFVPRDDGRGIGAVMFDAPPTHPRKPRDGRIVIRKRITDSNGLPVLAELGGIRFGIFDGEGQQLGEELVTNSAGHASSDHNIPIGTNVVVRELAVPAGLQPVAETTIAMSERRQIVEITNVATGASPGYGG